MVIDIIAAGVLAAIAIVCVKVLAGVVLAKVLNWIKEPTCSRCGADLIFAEDIAAGECWRHAFLARHNEKRDPLRRYCRWCATTTLHVPRRQRLHVCEHIAEHHATETYQRLAAAMPHADLYPGCICAPGEVTLFAGKPDPFCFAMEHRL